MLKSENLFHKKQDHDLTNQVLKTIEQYEVKKENKIEIEKEQNAKEEEKLDIKREKEIENEIENEYLESSVPKIKSIISLENKQDEGIKEKYVEQDNNSTFLKKVQSINKENEKSLEETLSEELKIKNEEVDEKENNKEKSISDEENGILEYDEEPIKVFASEVKSPLEWLLTGDKFASPIGNDELDEDYIRFVSYIFSTFAGSGLGLFLMSTGIFSGLGMAIFIYSNIPTLFIKEVFGTIDKATDGLIPLKKYKSITDYTIQYIQNSPKRIANKIENKEFKLKIKTELEKKKKATTNTKINSLLKKQNNIQAKQKKSKTRIFKKINKKFDSKADISKSMIF